ncbi:MULTISPECIES: bacteriocin immunity protein [Aerococcus]|uniref:Bacteriocin immunity protein n=1 Tax=Aerococcus sanguinicola TaxID=119206 RepID=A0A5N1GJQ6_9LACT|nr:MULTISPECIES: bacteriocin immunity protein [Aerococcus]KAA9301213.1 bacteriocin immunity protein [Aerococcus sanguinicola]MDK6369251.1 bacteriocin immunity protein [Aerococcus sp. UMB9870]MDK6679074.1 bacteriocin immunity protein [Aerococcus sp. UMB8608]MDK6686982.1 bacteriocin immunity protein [Aerococcus sp. UMB8623]MDK6940137.1 bacteriocin immunity protein [Aerococcus sp. UMB8487]
MVALKWYAGGKDRRKRAIELIQAIEPKLTPAQAALKQVLADYLVEFQESGTSTPYILTRLNLDLSKALRADGQVIAEDQEALLKELSALSQIRYGY